MMTAEAAQDTELCAIRDLLGPEDVLTDDASRELYSQDVYRSGVAPLAVVRPRTVEALAAVVKMATAAGLSLFPRGGGMSYTDAWLPTSARSLVVDTSALNRIREINATDLYVVVEAGATWAQLDAALAVEGLRARFWGPMSGRLATIGGACSQGAATYGSGRNGVSGPAVLGFQIVLASGEILTTGSGGSAARSPFFRDYGPDLTGLFAADNGALGIKATVTLAVEPRPGAWAGLSFSFRDFAGLQRGLAATARAALATEVFGAETSVLRLVAGGQNLKQDLATLRASIVAAPNVASGLYRAARIALAGRRFLEHSNYLINVMTEAPDRARLARLEADIRTAMKDATEIANTVPVVTHATPFPLPGVLGPQGRRLLPLHGIFPPSRIGAFHEEISAWRESLRAELERHEILLFFVFASVGRNGFLYEPVIFWRDSWPALHRGLVPAEQRGRMEPAPDNPAARAVVERMRTTIIDMMYRHSAVHLQIGRAYPYLAGRDAAFVRLLRAIKRDLDPENLINPGALGL